MSEQRPVPPIDEFVPRATAFLDAHATPRTETVIAHPIAEARAFQAALHRAGLAGLTWPVEMGGQGLGPVHQQAFDEVAERYDLPTSDLTLALNVCGPAVVQFGTEAQHARHVRQTLRGDQAWCQLWSEPEAGSDLASVRTTARRGDDGWVVRGHKIWTSIAQSADYALLLARTDPEAAKHRGLSMFIVPMCSVGVRVEPLRQITREAEFNEVWLDDVVLDDGALLGEEGGGWQVLTWMMGKERTSVGVTMRSTKTLTYDQVRRLAVEHGALDDPAIRQRLVALRSLQHAADALRLRLLQEIGTGAAPAALGSATKLVEAQLLVDAADLGALILEEAGTAWDPDDARGSTVADAQLKAPAFSIGGGTTEIQLNTLAEQVLRLPREPRPA